jgi:hypothetical protein
LRPRHCRWKLRNVPAAVSVHAIGLGYETATDDYL